METSPVVKFQPQLQTAALHSSWEGQCRKTGTAVGTSETAHCFPVIPSAKSFSAFQRQASQALFPLTSVMSNSCFWSAAALLLCGWKPFGFLESFLETAAIPAVRQLARVIGSDPFIVGCWVIEQGQDCRSRAGQDGTGELAPTSGSRVGL